MQENELSVPPDRHPLLNITLIFVFVGLAFLFIGPFIGVIIAAPFYPGTMDQLLKDMLSPMGNANMKVPMFIIQGCATAIGLIIAPMMLMRRTNLTVASLFRSKKVDVVPLLVTTFVVVTFMGFNSIFVQWNEKVHLPDTLKGIEDWARTYENAATELTKFLTTFDNPGQLILALIVIAVLPAIGEEIVFRGLLQNEFFRWTRNAHVSIWIAAFFFSAIHFQFFGFVPRLLLGALFGYLYYWSGNIWMSIVAHFVNNGFAVLAMYLYQKGNLNFDLDNPEAMPVNAVVFSTLVTGGLLYYFYKYFEQRKPTTTDL